MTPFSFHRVQRLAEISGLILLTLGAIYGFFFPASFFEGYLTAYVFWVEIALGCLALLFLQYLTGGLWGVTISRLLEAGMMTLPLCALLFLPILLGMTYLFPWVHPVGSELQHLVRSKSAYLNVPFYLLRYVLYFALLSAMALYARRLGVRRDANDPAALALLGKISGPALIVFVLIMNFASVDWIMSLNPEWYSSMLVVEFVSEQSVVVMAWSILVLRCLARIEPVRSALNEKVVHDLGKLLLGFICFWTYVTFSEYLITWMGNLPHEVSWFSDRSSGAWKAWAVLLVFSHFVVPMFCLIFTRISKNLSSLSKVAALVIVAHFIQVIWWVEPGFNRHFEIPWTSILLIVALGGIWLASYVRHLSAVPLLPLADPQLRKAQEAGA